MKTKLPKNLHLHLDGDLYHRAKAYANLRGLTMRAFVERAITQYISWKKWKEKNHG